MRENFKHSWAFLSLLIFFVCSFCQQQIFIDYGVSQQGWQLYRFFSDVEDGFYIDIGAYDPIFASNTLNLYSQGWGGINIDANPQRLNRFFLMRPDQTNLNYAIGDQNKYLTLYQLDQDSSSTVSQKVKQLVKDSKPVVAQIKVPSLSLKQICETYYYRKPIFMNLDIEGYGSKALQGNNWANSKCVPDLILSQINQQTIQSGLVLPQKILQKYGYKKFNKIIGLNQLYIHVSVEEAYLKKYNSMQNQTNNYMNVQLQQVASALMRKIQSSTTLFKHYQPTSDYVYYKFTKKNEVIDINKLNDQSNRLTDHQLQNRIIAIYHFNPKTNVIVIKQGIWKMQQIIPDNLYKYYQISVVLDNGKNFKVYIFDHRYRNAKGLKPKIIQSAKDAYLLQQKKQYNPASDQKLNPDRLKESQKQYQIVKQTSSLVAKQLQNQQQLLIRINQAQQNQSFQIKNTFISNHNSQINILQKISQKIIKYQQLLQNKTKIQINGNSKIDKIKIQLQNLRNIQNITIYMIGFMILSLCVTCCCVKRKNKKKIRYGGVSASDQSMTDVGTNV